nr:peroxiredoxin [uncultured Holophaga sp.]
MLQKLVPALFCSTLMLAGELSTGQPAPLFEARDQSGQMVRLADYRGKQVVVLYFYPKDGTPGCTAEACSLRDGYAGLKAAGAEVLGVSADDAASHAAFAAQHGLPFRLLEDPERKIIEAYGVAMPTMARAKRWTFIIDRKGIIRDIVSKVDPQTHDQQVLALLKELKD